MILTFILSYITIIQQHFKVFKNKEILIQNERIMDIPEKYSYFQLSLVAIVLNFENIEVKDFGFRLVEAVRNNDLKIKFLKATNINSYPFWLKEYIEAIVKDSKSLI